jgi:predicted Holliday junction resolvase-like endonuclease
MQQNDLIKFFLFQRQIFGQCPNCKELFRLNECNIYIKGKKQTDWKDKIDNANNLLSEKESEIRKASNLIGKQQAKRAVNKMDKVFYPKKLDHHDAYALLNPIDYVVFNGMEKENYKNIIFMDGKKHSSEMKKIQTSIAKTIEKENYEWITIRVEENGNIKQE